MTELRKVVLAGGSGSLGQALAGDLSQRALEVVVLSRRPSPDATHREVQWDGRSIGPWAAELDDPAHTAVVNLAGLVDARPTAANIAELRRSRVEATQVLVQASRRLDRPLTRWVQAATTAIWSGAGETRVTESTPVPTGAAALPQMTGVAVKWGQAAADAPTDHLVVVRTSIVLMPDSPAVDRLLLLARLFVGGRVGSGRQWFSWIHADDWLAVVRSALGLEPSTPLDGGIVVAAAPNPVRNADLMAALRRTRVHPADARVAGQGRRRGPTDRPRPRAHWTALHLGGAAGQRVSVRLPRAGGGPGRRGQLSCSTTKSTQPVSAVTSSGSTAGNIATRSWLRPSLR